MCVVVFSGGLALRLTPSPSRTGGRATDVVTPRETEEDSRVARVDTGARAPGGSRPRPGGGAAESATDGAQGPLTAALPDAEQLFEVETVGPSPISDQRVDVGLQNTCDVAVELFWVDFEGDERSYGVMQPHEAAEDLGTWAGHTWRMRTLDGGLLRAARAQDGARWVTCDDTHGPAASAYSAPVPAPAWPADVSTRSLERADIEVENTCDRELELRWIDQLGNERLYAQLAPGERVTQPSYHGHLWRLRTAEGLEVREFRATPGATVSACGASRLARDS